MVDDLPSKPDVSGFILLFFCEPMACKAVREGVVVAAAKSVDQGREIVWCVRLHVARPARWNGTGESTDARG